MAYTGHGGSVKIGANTVAFIESFTLDVKQTKEDVTQLDPSDALKKFIEKITTARELTGTIEANFNPADSTGQALILAHAFGTGTDTISLELYPYNGTVKVAFTAILDVSLKVPKSGVAKASYPFESTGKPVLTLS